VSDISLQFPLWFDLVVFVAEIFWPLTVVAAAAAIWLWLKRSRVAVWIVTVPVLVIWTVSAGLNLYRMIDNQRSRVRAAAELRSREFTLTEPTRIAGIMLPAKTVVIRGTSISPSASRVRWRRSTSDSASCGRHQCDRRPRRCRGG
jgi:hypothetical protein